MRINKRIRLRIKDVDFHNQCISIYDGKGGKDRVAVLPDRTVDDLKKQIQFAQKVHGRNLAKGYGRTTLTYAIVRKYKDLDRKLNWQYVFPSISLCFDTEPRENSKASSAHFSHSESCKNSSEAGGDPKAGGMPYVPTQFCDAPAGGWVRYPDHAGTAVA